MRKCHFYESSLKDHSKSITDWEAGRTRISNSFLKSCKALMRKTSNIYEVFFAFIKKLNKFFSITRAILVIRSENGALKVIAMKGNKSSREGLALTIPKKKSFLHSVLENGVIHSENNPVGFKGNFIEKKMLFNDETKSLIIIPIKYDGSITGLICFSSPITYAFEIFEEGVFDPVIEQFSEAIEARLQVLGT